MGSDEVSQDNAPQPWEDRTLDLLALVYRAVDWRRASGSKWRWDVWNHRVRAASTRGTLGEFVSRLCNYFGLQSLGPEAIEIVQELRPHEREILDWIYREHIRVATGAAMKATGR